MSQSSLESKFNENGVGFKRGVKVVAGEPGKDRSMTRTASDVWLFRWAKNSYRNYPLVLRAKGVKDLVDSCKGLPAFVVGIGPSLDAAMPALREALGKAVIIATDAAFRPLLANGITPNLVISFDCKPEQGFLWDGVPAHDVPILFDTCAHPTAIASWKGPILFYNHFHQADELSHLILPHIFPHVGQIPSGGTVGNVALLLSKYLGCEPAIVVGMDFCYAAGDQYVPMPGGWRYRARDYTFVDGAWKPAEVNLLYDNDERVSRSYMKTYRGVEYRMDPELVFYYETFCSFLPHFKIKAINCSMDGALKDVCETLPVDAAIRRYCTAAIPDDVLSQIRVWPDPRGTRE